MFGMVCLWEVRHLKYTYTLFQRHPQVKTIQRKYVVVTLDHTGISGDERVCPVFQGLELEQKKLLHVCLCATSLLSSMLKTWLGGSGNSVAPESASGSGSGLYLVVVDALLSGNKRGKSVVTVTFQTASLLG